MATFNLNGRKPEGDASVFIFIRYFCNCMRMRLNKIHIILLWCCLWAPFCSLTTLAQNYTVVIDPGHGGRDPGAIGRKGKEKDINLNVALKLGNLIKNNYKDVKVIYTRQKDVFVALDRRAQIANNAKADLFISIHTNSVAKNRTVRGTETYTLGLHRTDDNLEVAKKENSVILIESDYEQRYAGFNPNSSESYIIFEFLQDKNMEKSVQFATNIQRQFRTTAKRIDKGVHQAGFLVLRETSMPGVLVELGYISTPDEERYLLTESGTSALAKSIYQAFVSYKQLQTGITPKDISNEQPSSPAVEEEEDVRKPAPATPKGTASTKQPAATKNSGKPVFKVQILVSEKKLTAGNKQFKGLSPVNHYREKGLYKYTYGESTDYNKVLRIKKQIASQFKGAFIVAFKNGEKMDVNKAIEEFKKSK